MKKSSLSKIFDKLNKPIFTFIDLFLISFIFMLLAALLCGILMPITQETIIIPEGMNLVSADDINFEEIEEILNIQPSVIND